MVSMSTPVNTKCPACWDAVEAVAFGYEVQEGRGKILGFQLSPCGDFLYADRWQMTSSVSEAGQHTVIFELANH